MAVTLLQLRTRVFDLMDEGNSAYNSTSQANDQINNGYALLWNKYARADATFNQTDYLFTPTDGVRDYAMPADFKTLLRASCIPTLTGTIASQCHIPMRRTLDYRGGVPTGYFPPTGIVVPTYELLSNNLRLDPTPTAPVSFRIAIWYKSEWVALATDGATLDAAIDDSHAQWIVLWACIQLRTREEQPSADLQATLAAVETELQQDLAQRDQYQTQGIIMTDAWDGWR